MSELSRNYANELREYRDFLKSCGRLEVLMRLESRNGLYSVFAFLERAVQTLFSWVKRARNATITTAILGLVCADIARATNERVLHVLEITPSQTDNYTVEEELRQIKLAAQMAIVDYAKLEPCQVKVNFEIKKSTEEELYSKVKKISRESAKGVLVGMSRSDFARLAAKAAQGTQLKGISVGASISHLGEINPNFRSIVAPWERQWDAIRSRNAKEWVQSRKIHCAF